MRKVVTTKTGENFTHKILFKVAKSHLERSQKTKDGDFYSDLSAMVFVFHAFEAYLNFILERLAPDIFAVEEKYFKKEPYRGFNGKFRKIVELSGLNDFDLTVEPYQTIELLKELRDRIAHGKVEKTHKEVVHDDDEMIWPDSPFGDLVSREAAVFAVQRVHEVCQNLHTSARPKVDYTWFGDDPFAGPHAYASGETKLA